MPRPASLIVCFIVFPLSDGVAAGCALKEYSPRRGAVVVVVAGVCELSESERQSMTDKRERCRHPTRVSESPSTGGVTPISESPAAPGRGAGDGRGRVLVVRGGGQAHARMQ